MAAARRETGLIESLREGCARAVRTRARRSFRVKLRRTQYEYIFSTLPSNSDIAQRSLTVHSGLDFFDPDQGSAATWAQTAPRAGHGHGSAADSRDRRR